MKYLVVIALVALLLFLLYRRVRPYIKSLSQIVDVIRQFQKSSSPAGRQPGAEKLVRCATCGIWIPVSRALTSRSEVVFCSTKCLEDKK
ncbi:MAG TPA: PP0621 family protein [Pyrinomonadaceae bacterium]|nr:PP0621 family protein [Pyrinomonadaceae bacterium]